LHRIVLARSTLGAEEKSLVGIAIGGVVSLGLTGLAASMLEGTAPVRLSTHRDAPGRLAGRRAN
jgi:hypothetical protein